MYVYTMNGNCCSALGFTFSFSAVLLGVYISFSANWVHYESLIEPIDFGFYKVCYRDLHTCSFSDLRYYHDAFSTEKDILRVANVNAQNDFHSILRVFWVGLNLCLSSVILSIPVNTELKTMTGINVITSIIGFLSVICLLYSLPQLSYKWNRIWNLDRDFLHPGHSCVISVIIIILTTLALLCHVVVAYQSHKTIPFASTWIGRCLLKLLAIFHFTYTNTKKVFKTYVEPNV